MDPKSPSSDLDEYDSDTQHLLSHEQNRKKYHQQKKRNWAFLAVNIFVLLLNVGLVLMMSVPKVVDVAQDTQIARLPHDGQ